jgi:hypothetical protein
MNKTLSLPLALELTDPIQGEARGYRAMIGEVARYYDPVTQTTVFPEDIENTIIMAKATQCSDLRYTIGGDSIDEKYNCD